MAYERYCVICKKFFTTIHFKQRTHDYACRIVYDRQKMSAYNKKRYRKLKADKKASYENICAVCHKPFKTDRYHRDVICPNCQLNHKGMFDRKGFDYGYD